MTFEEWFAASAMPASMKHDLFDCWFQALVSRDTEVARLKGMVDEIHAARKVVNQHDKLLGKATTEIEFHEERWDQLRQQLAALRDHQIAYERETEQELASRDAEIERLKTVPMRYRRMAFNAQLQNENTQLCQQLAAALAACKLKDEAISDFLKQYPHMTKGYVLDALAIQPDDDALKAWIGEPVAWMITYDGKCMGFVPTEEANTVAVYSPKGLK